MVDDVNFTSPDDKVCEWNCVWGIIGIIPVKNGSCNQAPADEAGYYPDGILISEAPELITVSTGDKLNAEHVLYGLVGTFYLSID